MKISIKTNLYDILDKFQWKWVNVWLNDGKILKVFLLDIDFLEDNDVGDAIYLKDMNRIELYKGNSKWNKV